MYPTEGNHVNTDFVEFIFCKLRIKIFLSSIDDCGGDQQNCFIRYHCNINQEIIINTSCRKLPFGSGDYPDKLLFTKHWTKFLTHQTGNYPVTGFVSKPSRISLVELSIINTSYQKSHFGSGDYTTAVLTMGLQRVWQSYGMIVIYIYIRCFFYRSFA